ncbi:VOC family protein [Neorhizobium sp. NCHU2750]|uniref:VOC family protein n=1 Tax=Neorhizobium sp. NCHU2750 TaxID=1825976 RepID=UPI00211063F8
MNVNAIDHLVMNVVDVERSCRWYEQVLGMRRLDYGESPDRPRTALTFGSQRINLRPVRLASEEWMTAENAAIGSGDLCFLTTLSVYQVVMHLKACGEEIIEGPVRREGATGSMISVYCRDPDGSLIEISSYVST